ncbi:MAG: putative polyprotein [Hallsjon virus]|nr:MAG: putative polyprotein [Hallsjon virus]
MLANFRCWICNMLLNTEPVDIIIDRLTEASWDNTINNNVGNLLDQIGLMNYLDAYDGESAALDLAIINHDLEVFRSAMNRFQFTTCKVPSCITTLELQELKRAFPTISFGSTQQTTTQSAIRDAVVRAMTVTVKLLTGSEPNIWVPGAAVRDNVIIVQPGNEITTREVISQFEENDCKRIFYVTIEGEVPGAGKAVLNGRANTWRTADGIALLWADQDRPEIYDYDSLELVNSDLIYLDKSACYLKTIKSCCGYKLVCMTKTTGTEDKIQLKRKSQDWSQRIEVTIPTMTPTGVLGLVGGISLSRKKIKIIPTLINQLMVRNIKGDLGLQSLIDTARAIAIKRFSIANATISNSALTAEDCINHAFIAVVLGVRMRWRLEATGDLSTAKGRLNAIMTGTMGKSIAELILAGLGKVQLAGEAIGLLNSLDTDSLLHVHNYLSSSSWETLDMTANKFKNSYLIEKHINMKSNELVEEEACCHHKNCNNHLYTGNRCKCCGMLNAEVETEYCPCCLENWNPREEQTKDEPEADADAEMEQHAEVHDNTTDKDLSTVGDLTLQVAERFGPTYLQIIDQGPAHCWEHDIIKSKDARQTWATVIEYAPPGRFTCSTEHIIVNNTHNNPNTGDDCGYTACKITDESFTKDRFLKLTGKSGNFGVEDLLKVANSLSKNLMVVTAAGAFCNKSDLASDEFLTVVHSAVLQASNDHWLPARCTMKGPHNGYYLPNDAVTMKARERWLKKNYPDYMLGWNNDLAPRIRAEMELALNPNLTGLVEVGNDLPRPIIDMGQMYLTNNRKKLHNVTEGLFTMLIDPRYHAIVNELVNPNHPSVSKVLGVEYNTAANTPAEIIQHTSDEIRECVRTIATVTYEAGNNSSKSNKCWRSWIHCSLTRLAPNVYDISDSGLKLRSMDLALIKIGTTIMPLIVHANKGKCIVYIPECSTSKLTCKIRECKYSLGSAYRRLSGLMQIKSHEPLESTLKNATAVFAPPGWGKSTEICNIANSEKCLVLAMTTLSQKSLRSRINKPSEVRSLEWAVANGVGDFNKVLMDEATMVDAHSLAAALRDSSPELIMYGDTFQIGMIDTGLTPGTRQKYNVMEMCANKRTENTTRRFGETVCEQLRKLGMDVTSEADHDTEIVFEKADYYDDEHISDLINLHKPNVVLTFTNNLKRKVAVSQALGEKSETVHKYQGNQCHTSMIIQYDPVNITGSNVIEKQYVVSAATRCTHKMVWLTIGFGNVGNTLLERTMEARGFKGFTLNDFKTIIQKKLEGNKQGKISPANTNSISIDDSTENVSNVNVQSDGSQPGSVISRLAKTWRQLTSNEASSEAEQIVKDENTTSFAENLEETRPLEDKPTPSIKEAQNTVDPCTKSLTQEKASTISVSSGTSIMQEQPLISTLKPNHVVTYSKPVTLSQLVQVMQALNTKPVSIKMTSRNTITVSMGFLTGATVTLANDGKSSTTAGKFAYKLTQAGVDESTIKFNELFPPRRRPVNMDNTTNESKSDTDEMKEFNDTTMSDELPKNNPEHTTMAGPASCSCNKTEIQFPKGWRSDCDIEMKPCLNSIFSIATLAHITCMVQSAAGDLNITIGRYNYSIRARRGCSLCCGLKISCEGEDLLYIAEWYGTAPSRIFSVAEGGSISQLDNLAFNLHLDGLLSDSNEELVMDENNNSLLCDGQFFMGMLLDRIFAGMKDVGLYLGSLINVTEFEGRCKSYSQSNADNFSTVKNSLETNGMTVISKEPKNYPHMNAKHFPLKCKNGNNEFLATTDGEILVDITNVRDPLVEGRSVSKHAFIHHLKRQESSLPGWIISKISGRYNRDFEVRGLGQITGSKLVEGMIQDLDWHRTKQTPVADWLDKKILSKNLELLKNPPSIMFLTKQQIENYKSDVRLTMPGKPINESSLELVEDGANTVIDQVLAEHFKELDEPVDLITTSPWVSTISNAWKVRCSCPQDPHSKRNYEMNLLTAEQSFAKATMSFTLAGTSKEPSAKVSKVLELLNAHEKSEAGTLFTKSSVEVKQFKKVVVFGASIIPNISTIVRLQELGHTVYYLTAVKGANNNNCVRYSEEKETSFIEYHNGIVLQTPTDNYIKLSSGWLNSNTTSKVVCAMMGMRLHKVTAERPKYYSALDHLEACGQVTLKLPLLVNDPLKLMKGETFTIETVTVSTKTYEALAKRCLTEGTTLRDVLTAARVMLSTHYYSNTHSWEKMTTPVKEMQLTACAVYYEVKGMKDSLFECLRLMNFYSGNKPKLAALKSRITEGLLIGYSEIINELGLNFSIDQLADKLLSAFENKMHYSIKRSLSIASQMKVEKLSLNRTLLRVDTNIQCAKTVEEPINKTPLPTVRELVGLDTKHEIVWSKTHKVGNNKVKVLLATIGTTGDVVPFCEVAKLLVKAGHSVTIYTHWQHEQFVKANSPAEFIGFEGDPAASMAINISCCGTVGNVDLQGATNNFYRETTGAMHNVEALERHDIVITTPFTFGIESLAEKWGACFGLFSSQPWLSAWSQTMRNMPRIFSETTASMFDWLYIGTSGSMCQEIINRWRIRNGLPQTDAFQRFKPEVRKYAQMDKELCQWSTSGLTQGQWLAPTNQNSNDDKDLMDWVSNNEPIIISFGSMYSKRTETVIKKLLQIIKKEKVLLVNGWLEIDATGDNIKKTHYCNYAAVARRAKLFIHHGGAGTTQAVARAGCPQLIFPMFGDQPGWANMCAQKKIGFYGHEHVLEWSVNNALENLDEAKIHCQFYSKSVNRKEGAKQFVAWFNEFLEYSETAKKEHDRQHDETEDDSSDLEKDNKHAKEPNHDHEENTNKHEQFEDPMPSSNEAKNQTSDEATPEGEKPTILNTESKLTIDNLKAWLETASDDVKSLPSYLQSLAMKMDQEGGCRNMFHKNVMRTHPLKAEGQITAETNRTLCDIEPGELMYSPNVFDECVIEVIKSQLKATSSKLAVREHFKNANQLKFALGKHVEPLINSLNLSSMVSIGRTAVEQVLEVSFGYALCNVETINGQAHATVRDFKQVGPPKIERNTLTWRDNSKNTYLDVIVLGHKLAIPKNNQEMWAIILGAKPFEHQHLTTNLRNVLPRMTGATAWTVLSQAAASIVIVEVLQTDFGLLVTSQEQAFTSGEAVWFRGQKGYSVGVVFKTEEATYVMTHDRPLDSMVALMKLRVNVFNTINRTYTNVKTGLKTGHKQMFINEETRKTCLPLGIVATINGDYEQGDIWVVTDLDGQRHHGRDYREWLINAGSENVDLPLSAQKEPTYKWITKAPENGVYPGLHEGSTCKYLHFSSELSLTLESFLMATCDKFNSTAFRINDTRIETLFKAGQHRTELIPNTLPAEFDGSVGDFIAAGTNANANQTEISAILDWCSDSGTVTYHSSTDVDIEIINTNNLLDDGFATYKTWLVLKTGLMCIKAGKKTSNKKARKIKKNSQLEKPEESIDWELEKIKSEEAAALKAVAKLEATPINKFKQWMDGMDPKSDTGKYLELDSKIREMNINEQIAGGMVLNTPKIHNNWNMRPLNRMGPKTVIIAKNTDNSWSIANDKLVVRAANATTAEEMYKAYKLELKVWADEEADFICLTTAVNTHNINSPDSKMISKLTEKNIWMPWTTDQCRALDELKSQTAGRLSIMLYQGVIVNGWTFAARHGATGISLANTKGTMLQDRDKLIIDAGVELQPTDDDNLREMDEDMPSDVHNMEKRAAMQLFRQLTGSNKAMMEMAKNLKDPETNTISFSVTREVALTKEEAIETLQEGWKKIDHGYAIRKGACVLLSITAKGVVNEEEKVEWFGTAADEQIGFTDQWRGTTQVDKLYSNASKRKIAIILASGSGKTTLCDSNGGKYQDIDDLLTWREWANNEDLKHGDKPNWSAINDTFRRAVKNKADHRILLCHTRHQLPKGWEWFAVEGKIWQNKAWSEANLQAIRKDHNIVHKLPSNKSLDKAIDDLIKYGKISDNEQDQRMANTGMLTEFGLDCRSIITGVPSAKVRRHYMPFIEVSEGLLMLGDSDYSPELANIDVVNMFEDRDLTDWIVLYGPSQKEVLQSSEVAGPVLKSAKTFLTAYPIYARPVLNQVAYTLANAITGRLMSKQVVRTEDLHVKAEVKDFVETYFPEEAASHLKMFQNRLVTFDSEKIRNWLKDRPDEVKVDAEMEQILAEGFGTNPLNQVKVHTKVESLLKSSPIGLMKESQARLIAWQAKGICAMYSAAFKELKQRLKNMLTDNVVYSDGLTPVQLAARVRLVSATNTQFFENDLAKQDRQTDSQMLDCEFGVYSALGCDPNLLKSWRTVHDHWKFRGEGVQGQLNEMRLTGQATTALGNVIVNLFVHKRLFKENKNRIKLMLVLGDDNLILSEGKLQVKWLRDYIEGHWNMQSKPNNFENHGTFCCMVAYNTETNCGLGPDWVRLKRRYEVTNGVHEATAELIKARGMSYLQMLGAMEDTIRILDAQSPGSKLHQWYHTDQLVTALEAKYNMGTEEVFDNLKALLNMIEHPTPVTREWIYTGSYKHNK